MIPSVLDNNKIQNLAFLSYTVKATNSSVPEIHFMKFLHITCVQVWCKVSVYKITAPVGFE
jgi:hypothetical protein